MSGDGDNAETCRSSVIEKYIDCRIVDFFGGTRVLTYYIAWNG
jgi:hypothetical protein